jgi:hypothetical protein
MNGIFANYLWTMICFGEAYFEYFESCDFSRENTNIDIFVFMFNLRMINMSSECEYDLILKHINLLDRILWSLWLVQFAHSPTNFIFWLGRLIFSVSINSHPDNIYLSSFPPAISTCWLHKQNSYQSSRELSWTYQQWARVITKLSQHLNDNSCEDDKSK